MNQEFIIQLEEIEKHLDDPSPPEEMERCFRSHTHDLVSKVGYLLGLPLFHFESETSPYTLGIYQGMETDRHAKIIRSLCLLRTLVERNFKKINDKILHDYISIYSMPQIIPQEELMFLSHEGISFSKKAERSLPMLIMEINRLIQDRINNCRPHFPEWVNWNYIRELFIMPQGLTERGIRAAADLYYSNLSLYPYQLYLNWKPTDQGNILYNDLKFLNLIYEQHGDEFKGYSWVTTLGDGVLESVEEFMAESRKVLAIVDCENSNPYRLLSILRSFGEEITEKIERILLIEGTHRSTGWDLFPHYCPLPVERDQTPRIKADKSLVDTTLSVHAGKAHYGENVDSFILVSSDSDFWALVHVMTDARFLVMMERSKVGKELREAYRNSGIFYCYMEDSSAKHCDDLRTAALYRQLKSRFGALLSGNAREILKESLWESGVEMGEGEKEQFYHKLLRELALHFSENGDMSIEVTGYERSLS